VVLATGWSLRQTVLALTCFTAGHALTLAACAWGAWVVPSRWVEPAIAATIIGMALFDRWSQNRSPPWPVSVRLSLVFACALIHGLGLAGALIDLGLEPEHLLLTVTGFNVGIESGQLAVTLLAAGFMRAVEHFKGAPGLALTRQLASLGAMVVGSMWLVQRVIVPA
jgi:hypothetical protein